MTNLAKLEFAALDITGKNYLTWVLDTKIHLKAGNLGDTIREESSSSSRDLAKPMIFIRRYLDEALKSEYLTDFKSVAEYNFALFRITSQMKLYGDTITEEHMLEKTLSTFHASNVFLQQQYRAQSYTEYNQLISVLLVAEQNNELLMKKHHSRPIGPALFPEVNAVSLKVNATSSGGDNHKQGRGHKQGPSFKNVNRHKGKAHMNNTSRNSEGACHRYGGNGYWARTCCTPKHLMDLYQASLKEKGVETNFLDQARPMDIPDPVFDLSGQLNTTHLDVPDFNVERRNEVYQSD
ncbi:uncharacterized protein [Pyrus communis]|uniref:uncharacterized protein n=1 Tax=Pyrus communis TaxID=23211 RepID=UPI0035BF382E